MNVLTINESKSKLEWTRPSKIGKKKNRPSLTDSMEVPFFISEFPSPTDEIVKTESKSSVKKKRPFSHTSENWLG
ncbi:MAG: hypothetical protein CVV24_08590 [Ignavibacteriae bacterium HGW-Ignavibacteriae-3]|nr:MAG: hypothetical protein CVV24_08590 [Ignavibacteriae bacterium HGW-Ignavibacteriae-3]